MADAPAPPHPKRSLALFSQGFRLFFPAAALWAAVAMALWLAMLSGVLYLPSVLDPIAWHAHALLFGYLGAVIAGFLLTAVPNWTGRPPVSGAPLVALFALWLAGRGAGLVSADLPLSGVVALELAFPLVLAAAMTREIVAARLWRNLPVIALLGLFALAQGLFYLDVAREGDPTHGLGLRLGLSAAVMLIALIGGRILPAFTRNWLSKRGAKRLPAAPMQRFDRVALAGLALALALWSAGPDLAVTAVALLAAGGVHLIRLARWHGHHTGAEPLVWILHVGYAFVPLGALVQALAILWPDGLATPPAQHLWMAGAIGVMTLAVMTRATLGHTGHELHAGAATLALYLGLIGSVAARVLAGVWAMAADPLLMLSGLLWIGAFAGFAVIYGPLAIAPRSAG